LAYGARLALLLYQSDCHSEYSLCVTNQLPPFRIFSVRDQSYPAIQNILCARPIRSRRSEYSLCATNQIPPLRILSVCDQSDPAAEIILCARPLEYNTQGIFFADGMTIVHHYVIFLWVPIRKYEIWTLLGERASPILT
jgi:hypothetical protein